MTIWQSSSKVVASLLSADFSLLATLFNSDAK